MLQRITSLPRQHPVATAAVLAVALGAAMAILVRFRVLDPYVAGTAGDAPGQDWFSIPRGWINWRRRESMYNPWIVDYGPVSLGYLSHPFLIFLVGSWAAQLQPWTSYAAFIGVSIVMLVTTAILVVRAIPRPSMAFLLPICLLASLPSYLMIWNAQPHVFPVVATVLVFAGLARSSEGLGDDRINAWLIAGGLLLSLLSKPVLVLILPALFTVPRLRRPLLVALGAYAAVSLAFLAIPRLNPQRIHWTVASLREFLDPNGKGGAASDNLYHWLYVIRTAGQRFPGDYELFSLPTFFDDAFGGPPPAWFRVFPALAVLLCFPNLFERNARRRFANALLLAALAMSCHFVSYTQVWEYHYTLILALAPFLLLVRDKGDPPPTRALIAVAFGLALMPIVPTLWAHYRPDPQAHLVAIRLPRVVPAVLLYAVLAVLIAHRGADLLRSRHRLSLPVANVP
jgi:hypothetical protein